MATDGDVVGRIREAHFRLIGPEHAGIALGLQGVAAKNAMLAKMPEITQTGHRRRSIVDRWQLVFLVDAVTIQQGIDLAHLEAADLETDVGRKFQYLGQLNGERLAV